MASDNDAKVAAIKSSFCPLFGLARIYGIPAQPKNVAPQPTGFSAAKQGALERIDYVRHHHPEAQEEGSVIVAIENFLLEVGSDEWVDQGCLVLNDKTRGISLCAYTQPVPVPFEVIEQLQKGTEEDYPLSWSGFSSTVGSKMAERLKVSVSQWHLAACGVSRLDLLRLAAKTLAHAYQSALQSKLLTDI